MKSSRGNDESWLVRSLGAEPWWLAPYSAWGFLHRLKTSPAIAVSEAAAGLFIGALAMTLVLAAHLMTGLSQLLELHPAVLQQFSPQALMLQAALVEEVLYRGLVLTALLHYWRRPWGAMVVSALLFGLAHASRPHATWLSILSNSLGGMMYALPYVLTGRLYFSAGLHFAWNWTQGIAFGFPMSGVAFASAMVVSTTGPAWVTGAAYGPEGGVIGIAARLLIIAISVWLLRRRNMAHSNPLNASRTDTA